VKYFAWDDAKNAKLKADRCIGFEDKISRLNVSRDRATRLLLAPKAPL